MPVHTKWPFQTNSFSFIPCNVFQMVEGPEKLRNFSLKPLCQSHWLHLSDSDSDRVSSSCSIFSLSMPTSVLIVEAHAKKASVRSHTSDLGHVKSELSE